MRNHGRIQVGGLTDIRNELGKRSRPIGPLLCALRDRMPPREDDDLSLLRALVDDLILDVAEGWRWARRQSVRSKSLKITLVQMPAQIALPRVPHCLCLLAARWEQTEKQAAGEPQPDWIVCPPAPARRIAACRPPQPDPCSELPRPRSAWPAPAEPEPTAVRLAEFQSCAGHGWWSRPQGPARSGLSAGRSPQSARVLPQAAVPETLLPSGPAGCAARLERHRRFGPPSLAPIGQAARVLGSPAGGLLRAAFQPPPTPECDQLSAGDGLRVRRAPRSGAAQPPASRFALGTAAASDLEAVERLAPAAAARSQAPSARRQAAPEPDRGPV